MKRVLTEDTVSRVGETVKIAGFVSSVRMHGKILFIDLRDYSGIMQTVVISACKHYAEAKKIRPEWVIEVTGKINERPEKMKNESIKTGGVELEAEEVVVLSEAKTIPFSVDTDGHEINEETRMKYRYVDLRRKRLNQNLKLRHKLLLECRKFLDKEGFVEVETPILTKSTPEGARDFLVPSRLHFGRFYALPQSPQQYKQLLMVAGIEKYFQIARCFRDEDLRADRQAEFTQIDIELSFVEKEDVLLFVEKMVTALVETLFPEKKITKKPFPKISYKEAMEKWKTDRPDLRDNPEDSDELAFAFVVDFPMFEKNEKKEWVAVHHPFTKPDTEDLKKITESPEEIKGLQYDLVLNGNEIAGGSIRSHVPEVIESVFQVLGYRKEEVREKFGHLLEAFKYGVPPHGGIAFGFERFLMVLTGEKNIREVIAFPKTGDGRELTMGTPSADIEKSQLDELGIKYKKNPNPKKGGL